MEKSPAKDDEASPRSTESTAVDCIEVYSNEGGGGAVSNCGGTLSQDRQVAERPYRIYEKERQQREVRRLQREARAAERARKRQLSKEGGSTSKPMEDDPEQPQEVKLGFSAEDYLPGYLYGPECQLLSLMLLLITTTVIVGLVNRRDRGDDVAPSANITANPTETLTLSPSPIVESTIGTSFVPPTTTFAIQPSTTTATSSVDTTTTTTRDATTSVPPPTTVGSTTSATFITTATLATTTASSSSTLTSPTTGQVGWQDIGGDGVIEWYDDLSNLDNDDNTQLELFAAHAMGTTVQVTVVLPDDSVPHTWYTTVEFVGLGSPCNTQAVDDAVVVSSTILDITMDTTLVVCQESRVVATTTHLFVNDWDTRQSYETVSLNAATLAGSVLGQNPPDGATMLVVAVVTNPDETVIRVPAETRRERHLRPNRQLSLGDEPPNCPINGVPLLRPNPTYPLAVWLVERDTTKSDLVVCNVNGRVAARGTITFNDTITHRGDMVPWP